jgi:hypothetical protein
MDFKIIYAERAVWINDETGCLGRFGRLGVDVHRIMEQQMEGLPVCLACTHEPTSLDDWELFKDAMLKYHNVDLWDAPVPEWLRAAM